MGKKELYQINNCIRYLCHKYCCEFIKKYYDNHIIHNYEAQSTIRILTYLNSPRKTIETNSYSSSILIGQY